MLIDIEEVKRRTGLSYWRIYGFIRRGELKLTQRVGSGKRSPWGFTADDVERLLSLDAASRRSA